MTNSDDPVAFSFNGSTVYDSDIQTLGPKEWVGDAVIMLLFSLLEEEAHLSDIELWSPAVVQLLCTTDESSLDPTMASSLFPPRRKFNILPISDAYSSDSNTVSSHWSLLLIYSSSSTHTTAYHFDSMEPHNSHAAARCNANFASAFDRMPTQIRAIGQAGWSSSSSSSLSSSSSSQSRTGSSSSSRSSASASGSSSSRSPAGSGAVLQSQENAWDCGVYVLALTNGLVHRLSSSNSASSGSGSGSGSGSERARLEWIISDVVEAEGRPRVIEEWRSAFGAWMGKWQEEARRSDDDGGGGGGGGVWDTTEEVVNVLGPWAPSLPPHE